ncbi:hypothetical protein D3C73_1022230 [compost metagenome]
MNPSGQLHPLRELAQLIEVDNILLIIGEPGQRTMDIIEMPALFVKLQVNFLQPPMPQHTVFTEHMLGIAAQRIAVFLLLLCHLPHP